MEMDWRRVQNSTPLVNTPTEVAVCINLADGTSKEFHAGDVERLTHAIMADDVSIALGFREDRYERAWHVLCENLCRCLDKLDD